MKLKAETRFRAIVRGLLAVGVFPSGGAIKAVMDRRAECCRPRPRGGVCLSGAHTRWRADELEKAGYAFVCVGRYGERRWRKAS